jgi:hypothetical protein
MVLQSELEILPLVDAGFNLFEESAKPNHVIPIISQTIISVGTSWAARVGQNIIALTVHFGSLLPVPILLGCQSNAASDAAPSL